MSEEECLTLGQLQLAKRNTQRQDELPWQTSLAASRQARRLEEKVKDVRDELARRNGRVGHLEYRIAAAEREEHDV